MRLLKRIISVGCILVIAYIIVTAILASTYTVLVADDYAIAHGIRVFHGPFFAFLSGCLAYTGRMWMNWTGVYFSTFLEAFLNPINNFGAIQLKIVMALNVVLFFAALFVLLRTLFRKYSYAETYLKAGIMLLICLVLFGYYFYEEAFLWYTGAMEYPFSLSILMIALSCYIRMHDGEKTRRYFALSIALGIIAMGGVLMVGGAGCWLLLVIDLYYWLGSRKIDRKDIIVFCVWVVGAAVNAFAPGNFSRHDAINSFGTYPIHAVFDSVYIVDSRLQFFFTGTNFVFLMILLFICGILLYSLGTDKVDVSLVRNRLIAGISGILAPVVAVYPVALGYSSQDIPNRCEFIIDVIVVLWFAFMSVHMGMLVAYFLKDTQKLLVYAAVLAAVCCMIDGYSLSDIKFVEVSKQVKNGIYREYFNSCWDIYESLANSEPGSDIVLSKSDIPEAIDNSYPFYLSEDPENWVNACVAEAYGLNSVSVK